MAKRLFEDTSAITPGSLTPRILNEYPGHNGPSFGSLLSFDGLVPVRPSAYDTGVTTTRLPFLVCRVEHDNTNDPINQRECVFSRPAEEHIGVEKIFTARQFNTKYADLVIDEQEVKNLVSELQFLGVSLASTTLTDKHGKSALNSPWTTSTPAIDVIISGSAKVLDSWPKAKASHRLYFILKVTETKTNGRYTVQLIPTTKTLNDPTIGDDCAVIGKPWIRGAYFSVGTIHDPLPLPVPDLSTNTFESKKSAYDQLAVRDRVVDVSRRPYLAC